MLQREKRAKEKSLRPAVGQSQREDDANFT